MTERGGFDQPNAYHGVISDPGSHASMRSAATRLHGQFILALAQVHDMPEQPVRCPISITDLDHDFRTD